jgi:hypothetical protein
VEKPEKRNKTLILLFLPTNFGKADGKVLNLGKKKSRKI